MSTAKTAAAIGLNITANNAQATQAIGAVNKQLSTLQSQTTGVGAELRDMAVNGLERVTFGMGRAAVSTAKWGVGLTALTTTAAAVGLVDMARDFATGAASMGRSADMLGIPVDKLSQFGIAAHLAGSSAEKMQAGLQGLQQTVSDAAFGQNNAAFAEFRAAGIDVGDRQRGAASYLAMLPKIADQTQKLARVNAHAAETFLDMTGLGREMFPVLKDGAAGLAENMRKAGDMNPITPQQVTRARQLELTMTGLEERFASFGREAGAAVAPGLTKALDGLEHFLGAHKSDVADFFGAIEHGIEWLATPRNIGWLHEEADKIVSGFKQVGHLAEDLEHSWLFRKMFGLPAEGYDADHGLLAPPGTQPQAGAPDTRHWWERFYKPGPGLIGGASPVGAVNGSTNDAMAALVKMGWEPGDAAGIVGNLQQESSLNPQAGAGTAHQGIAQWDEPRRRAIEQHFGKSLMEMSLAEQFGALNWTMTEGADKATGLALRRGSHEPGQAAATFDRMYERPANPGTPQLAQEDALRSANARKAFGAYNPGADRMAADATAAAATPAASDTAAASAAARLARLKVEIRHTNPPPGTTVHTSTDQPGYIDLDGPRVMGAMPTTGTQRNVVKDGY